MTFDEQWREFEEWHQAKFEDDPRRWFIAAAIHDRWSHWRFFMALLNRSGGSVMARGKSDGKKPVAESKQGWTTFINVSLPEGCGEDIQTQYGKPDVVSDLMEELVRDGYRLSFSYAFDNEAVICSITCKAEGHLNEGKTFTSFADNWYQALQVTLYKHFVVLEEKWPDAAGKKNRPAFG